MNSIKEINMNSIKRNKYEQCSIIKLKNKRFKTIIYMKSWFKKKEI